MLDACPICLENVLVGNDAKLNCGHAIHVDCAKQLHDARCPICRATISVEGTNLSLGDFSAITQRQKADKKKGLDAEQDALVQLAFREAFRDMFAGFVVPAQVRISIPVRPTAPTRRPSARERHQPAVSPDPPETSAAYLHALDVAVSLVLKHPREEARVRLHGKLPYGDAFLDRIFGIACTVVS